MSAINWSRWAQIGGVVVVLYGLVSMSDQNAWDHEVSAQEVRTREEQSRTNAQMLKEVLHQQQLQGIMLQQQILSVQIDIMQNEIERYTDLLLTTETAEHFWIKEKITQLERRLSDKRRELTRILVKPVTHRPDGQ